MILTERYVATLRVQRVNTKIKIHRSSYNEPDLIRQEAINIGSAIKARSSIPFRMHVDGKNIYIERIEDAYWIYPNSNRTLLGAY